MNHLDKLSRDLATGRTDRRGFMQGALALGLGVPAASAIVSKVEAAMPKKGGMLRAGLAGASTSESYDPATYVSIFQQMGLNFAVQNNLTEVNENSEIIPELAESFEASADAKTWEFKLRRGVEFHNGKTFEAEDVLASLNHHRGDDSESAAKPLLAAIEEMRAEDKHTVVFKLAEGNADFPFVMNDYHLPMCPSKDGKIIYEDGAIGTGGYVMEEHEPGVRMELRRNPNYFKGDARAHFEEVELIGIADVTARQNALITGEIDVMNRVDIKTAGLLARNKSIEIDEVTGTQHYTIPMDTRAAPFDDNNVRLALKYAIDREKMVETILQGHGKVGNDHPIAPANQYYAGDLEQRVYDPDKAKFHLKKAGMDSLSLDLHAANAAFEGAIDTAVLYKEHAAKAGIDINVVRAPNDGYWSNTWMKKPWTMSYWGGRPTEDWMFSVAYAAGGDWNETFWSNDRFMELLKAARAELDGDKRRQMYREMQMIVRDDGGAVVPMYANYIDAHSKKLAHGPLAKNWELDGWKMVERWWFA